MTAELTSAITDAVARGQLEMARNLRREKLYRAFIVALNTRITTDQFLGSTTTVTLS